MSAIDTRNTFSAFTNSRIFFILLYSRGVTYLGQLFDCRYEQVRLFYQAIGLRLHDGKTAYYGGTSDGYCDDEGEQGDGYGEPLAYGCLWWHMRVF